MHAFKTGVGPAFAFPTEKVIHEARFFDHTGDCKMTHTFKTGGVFVRFVQTVAINKEP